MDEIEKFVREHRGAFDDQRPDRMKIWNKIEQNLDSKQPVKRVRIVRRWMSLAASIVIMAVIGSIFILKSNTNKPADMIAEQEELHDINSYYNQLINYKVQQVRTSTALSQEDKEEFLEYFKELETACELLEKDLDLQFDNEQVLSAIVENYRQRLNLLENLLKRLNQTKVKQDEKTILL